MALKNLEEKKIHTILNLVINKYNAHTLPETVEFVAKKLNFIKEFRICYPRFFPPNYFKEHILSYNKIDLELSLCKKNNLNITAENFPLCVADLDKYGANTLWDCNLVKDGQIYRMRNTRFYPQVCENCSKRKQCQGIDKFYNRYFNWRDSLHAL
jgi:MoaA/NifB/PqqE/SkfB family radical SAM enzyme